MKTQDSQTENEVFLGQMVEIVKAQIIETLEKEKYRYTEWEYKALIAKALELAHSIKSRFGSGGDVFFKAGVFLAQSHGGA